MVLFWLQSASQIRAQPWLSPLGNAIITGLEYIHFHNATGVLSASAEVLVEGEDHLGIRATLSFVVLVFAIMCSHVMF